MSSGPIRHKTSSAIEVQHQTDELGNSTGSVRIATQVEDHGVALHSASELQALKDVDPAVLALYLEQVRLEAEHRRSMQLQFADHRQSLEVEDQRYRQATTEGKLALARRGQWFGFVIGVLGLGATCLAIWTGSPWLAGVLGALNLGGMISAFLKSHATSGDGAKPDEADDAPQTKSSVVALPASPSAPGDQEP